MSSLEAIQITKISAFVWKIFASFSAFENFEKTKLHSKGKKTTDMFNKQDVTVY